MKKKQPAKKTYKKTQFKKKKSKAKECIMKLN